MSCFRLYRVVSGNDFVDYFASDRRHMRLPDRSRDAQSGSGWLSPPPTYDCLRGPKAPCSHTLLSYLDMRRTVDQAGYGRVLTESSFFECFGCVRWHICLGTAYPRLFLCTSDVLKWIGDYIPVGLIIWPFSMGLVRMPVTELFWKNRSKIYVVGVLCVIVRCRLFNLIGTSRFHLSVQRSGEVWCAQTGVESWVCELEDNRCVHCTIHTRVGAS